MATGERGFALVWLVVTLVMMLLLAGLTLDAGRAYVVKTQLTKAVDGAALGAARALNSGDPAAEARSIFRANFPAQMMGTTATDPTAAGNFFSVSTNEAQGTNIIQVRASVTMNTTFMNLANIRTVQVSGFGEATRRMVDLCLVLDQSGSLRGRWPAVRDAARAFVRAFDEDTDRFCLVSYSSGADVDEPITVSRGFNKNRIVSAIPNSIPSDGYTSMAEGLWRGWDELRSIPRGQQSSLRVIVLFTDGAANGVPGIYSGSSQARSLNTSDFPKDSPDPDNNTSNTPTLTGLFHTETGSRSPSASDSFNWQSQSTLSIARELPTQSTHAHGRAGVGTPMNFPLQTSALTVDGVPQSNTNARGLLNRKSNGRYPAHIRNTNNAARNLVEIIANEVRADTSGDYRIRIYTIGMGSLLRLDLGTNQEKPERIMMRVANDIDSLDFNETQLEGKYYFAATEADVSVAFQELQNQIIRLSK